MEMERFLEYLKNEKKTSPNTVEAYRRDVIEFSGYMKDRFILEYQMVTNTDVVGYLLSLKDSGKSTATVNRKISSLRTFFNWLRDQGVINENPAVGIKAPKVRRKEVEYLTTKEINSVLDLPKGDTPISIRDRALLELLYATGARSMEVIEAEVSDLNLRLGFMTFTGEHGKARIVPLGSYARKALEEYLKEARPKLQGEPQGEEDGAVETALFLNYKGEPISRQGMWKVLREYGRLAGLEKELTPQIIRHSFAVHMLQNGADPKSLQELMGLEDISAMSVYMDIQKNRIKDVYDMAHPRA